MPFPRSPRASSSKPLGNLDLRTLYGNTATKYGPKSGFVRILDSCRPYFSEGLVVILAARCLPAPRVCQLRAELLPTFKTPPSGACLPACPRACRLPPPTHCLVVLN